MIIRAKEIQMRQSLRLHTLRLINTLLSNTPSLSIRLGSRKELRLLGFLKHLAVRYFFILIKASMKKDDI